MAHPIAAVDWQMVSALGAIVVGLAALGAAVADGVATRRHNRLSVRPLLRLDCYETEGIRLYNTGSGPAILQNFEALADGQPIQHQPDDAPAVLAAEAVGLGEMLDEPAADQDVFFAYTPSPGDSLMAKEHFDLLRVNQLPADRAARNEVYEALLRISFRIHYASVYDEKQVFE